MRTCRSCGRAIEDDFRFCPGCGAPQRLKVVEHFLGDRRLDDGGLRVSLCLGEPQHVRLSIWHGDRAQAALSLEPAEATRLAAFLERLRPPRRGAKVVQRLAQRAPR